MVNKQTNKGQALVLVWVMFITARNGKHFAIETKRLISYWTRTDSPLHVSVHFLNVVPNEHNPGVLKAGGIRQWCPACALDIWPSSYSLIDVLCFILYCIFLL